jgi:uncharacterized protein (TIGR02453 family)
MSAAPIHGFAGFSGGAFTFFRNLAKNNNKEWFHANKGAYEVSCRDALKALTVVLDPPFGADRLTRINRDMRFARDKSAPYHTHISTVVRGNYISLSADGLYVGTGIYMPDAATLRRLREAIAADASGRKLASIVATLRRKGYTVGTHESVAGAPRGFSADHPRLELLRMNDIHAGTMFGASSKITTARAVQHVRRACEDIAPLREWIYRYATPSRGVAAP